MKLPPDPLTPVVGRSFDAWVQRYLTLLGVEREAPSLEGLARLTRAHVLTVPFENASSILRRSAHPPGPVPPLDLEQVLAGWEQQAAGGVCFVISSMFTRLLLALGYQAHQILADISFPASHQAVVVALNGRSYLLDAGNNAPFLAPIPLGETSEIQHAQLGYRFRHADAGTVVQDRWIDDEWAPFCTYSLAPAGPAQLEAAYQRHHTPGQSWVMDQLRLGRSTADAHYSYREQQFTVHEVAAKRRELIPAPETLAQLAVESFGLPPALIHESLAAQQRFRSAAKA